MIEIGESKSAAVLEKIKIDGAGDIGECSVAIVGVEDIALVTAPCGRNGSAH